MPSESMLEGVDLTSGIKDGQGLYLAAAVLLIGFVFLIRAIKGRG